VPWCDGKNRLTHAYRWFLASWARRLSWSEVATIFGSSWNSVYRAVEHAVTWGMAHRDLLNVTAIGVDEVAWSKGHNYLTLVYQINDGMKRLLSVTLERTEASLRSGLSSMGTAALSTVQYVASDMWRPYLKVLGAELPQAIHVLDRFHIMQKFGKALDQIRALEVRQLKEDGYEPVLKRTRWLLLKRPENLTEKQTSQLDELLKYNLRSVRGYLLREDFQRFWSYKSPYWAGRFLDDWCARTDATDLEPMQKVSEMLQRHRAQLLNWFRANGKISSGSVEGMNTRLKLVTRKSYGFRTFEVAKTALLHNLGDLPTQKSTHSFC
jgi:transposase